VIIYLPLVRRKIYRFIDRVFGAVGREQRKSKRKQKKNS
jgi:hypothetical protein